MRDGIPTIVADNSVRILDKVREVSLIDWLSFSKFDVFKLSTVAAVQFTIFIIMSRYLTHAFVRSPVLNLWNESTSANEIQLGVTRNTEPNRSLELPRHARITGLMVISRRHSFTTTIAMQLVIIVHIAIIAVAKVI